MKIKSILSSLFIATIVATAPSCNEHITYVGSTIYTGTAAPTANIGKAGDYYIDRTTGNMYGPKTESSWPTSPMFSIKGEKGEKGADGASIRYGSGAPTAQTPAKDEDLYIDITNKTLYIKEADGSWSGGISLRGEKGEDGATIHHNSGAPTAQTSAKNGDLYLDITNKTLYIKEADGSWSEGISLRGEKGADGSIIHTGTEVPTAQTPAKDGDLYFNMTNKNLYLKANGSWSEGVSLRGERGTDGEDGNMILTGNNAPDNNDNEGLNEGDIYIDLTNKALYRWDGNTWGEPISLISNNSTTPTPPEEEETPEPANVTPGAIVSADGELTGFSADTDGPIVLSNSVTKIATSAFSGRTHRNLTSIQGNKVVEIAENTFSAKTELTTVNFPKLKKIGASAFNRSGLKGELNFPELTEIGNKAFSNGGNMAITKLTAPKLAIIGDDAFFNCSRLNTLVLGATAPTVGNNAFQGATDPYTEDGEGEAAVEVRVPANATGNYTLTNGKWLGKYTVVAQ